MKKLLSAVAGAASFTLGSVWPLRWPSFPVSFFDFEMFNRAADDLWARRTAEAAARAKAAATKPESADTGDDLATSLPMPTPDEWADLSLAMQGLAALQVGDLPRAIEILKRLDPESADQAEAFLSVLRCFDPLISAVGTESSATKAFADPSAADGPVSEPSPPKAPSDTGQPASAVARVRRLHRQYRPLHVDLDTCSHCNTLRRFPDVEPWPCPTILALDHQDETAVAAAVSK